METRLTTTGSVLGTPQYMAPEQIAGEAGVRADVYSLGACLWECIGGAPPFRGDTPGAVLLQVLSAPPPSLADVLPDLPPEVDALVGRLLAKDPDRRPEDMDAVVLELSELLAGRGPAVALSRAERPAALPTAPSQPPVGAPAGAKGALLGRARELGQLQGLLTHAVEDGRAVQVAITGDPGIGRTALLHTIEQLWEGNRHVARCPPAEGGTPFALVRRLLREGPLWPDLRDGDPSVLADRLRLAWLDALDAWSTAPLAFFVDDLHLADLPSLRFLALAVGHLGKLPFALVFTAGPDVLPAFADSYPNLTRVSIGPLGERALGQLALRWGAPGTDVIPLCGGNPGVLARLCRGTGSPAWSRLESLPADLRRVARACALAGGDPDPLCVAALLGCAPGDRALAADLAALVHGGLLVDQSGLHFPGEVAREAILRTCTDADRRRAAAVMVRWLDGRRRPAERASHLLVLGERAEATRELLAAARLGVAAGDDGLTERYLDAAEQAAEDGQGGEVALMQGQVAFWRGQVGESAEAAARAMARLPGGHTSWFQAAGLRITALGQQGETAALLRVVDAVLTHPTTDDDRIIALCRAVSQLSTVEGASAPLAGAALVHEARRPGARAWQARARAALASTYSLDASIAAQVEAHRAHVLAGDPRSAAQVGLFLGSWYIWSGAWERAAAAIEDARRTARRLGATYLELWGRYVYAKLCVEVGAPLDALSMLEGVAGEASGSPRIRAGAQIYGAIAALRAGEVERSAALAAEAEGHPAVFRAARAARCRALVAGAGPVADLARGLTRTHGREVEWDELIHLALAEIAPALGEDPRPRVADAAGRIRERAGTLADPLWRNDYLARPHLVARTLSLEEELNR